MKFRFNKNFGKKAIAIVLAFAMIIGVVSLVSAFGEDAEGYKTVYATYTVGDISKTTGSFVKDAENALYTKDIIECTGIKLYADFDSDIEYTVHFYDEDETWLSCMSNEGLNLTVEDMPEDTFGVRIVIYPQSDENGKIGIFEKSQYANQLTIKVTNKVIATDND